MMHMSQTKLYSLIHSFIIYPFISFHKHLVTSSHELGIALGVVYRAMDKADKMVDVRFYIIKV